MRRSTAWLVAVVGTLTMTVSYIDRATLAVLAPTVTNALHISEVEYGWLGSAFSIAYLLATPVSGWLIDRVGARRGLVGSVLVWSSVAALHALVPGFHILFVMRIALGVAEGPGFPGAAQTVQRVLLPIDRPRAFGLLFTGSSIGGMLAPILATFLFRHAGWRVAFLGTAMIGLLWVPLWIAVTSRADVRAAMDAPETAPTARRSPVLEVLFHRAVLRALGAIFAAAPLFAFVQLWGAKLLVRTYGTKQGDVGDYLWLPLLMFDAGALLFGDLASRHPAGRRGLFAIGLVLALAHTLLPFAGNEWGAVIILGTAMAGGGALYTITTAELLARMPPGNVSLAAGIMAGAQSLALVIVNPLIGWSVERTGGYSTAAVALGLWAIPGSLVWLFARPPAP